MLFCLFSQKRQQSASGEQPLATKRKGAEKPRIKRFPRSRADHKQKILEEFFVLVFSP